MRHFGTLLKCSTEWFWSSEYFLSTLTKMAYRKKHFWERMQFQKDLKSSLSTELLNLSYMLLLLYDGFRCSPWYVVSVDENSYSALDPTNNTTTYCIIKFELPCNNSDCIITKQFQSHRYFKRHEEWQTT